MTTPRHPARPQLLLLVAASALAALSTTDRPTTRAAALRATTSDAHGEPRVAQPARPDSVRVWVRDRRRTLQALAAASEMKVAVQLPAEHRSKLASHA